ncbi:MAG: bacterial transcriptional activator domain-containing protein [Solirubrobacterales bacterium]
MSGSGIASEHDAYTLFQQGVALISGRHWAQAVVPLEKARRLEPDKTSIREALGRAHFHSGRYRDAAREFEAIVELSPTNDYAHFCLARSFEKLGNRMAARRHFSLACGLRPDRSDYRLYRERARAA